MGRFFSTLRYSFGNEDWRTEQEALSIRPDDTILCITASGDRPLNLLVNPCKKIVALDANASQNALLVLKKGAMALLPFGDYLAFLGALPSEKREETLQVLLPHFPKEVAHFWKEQHKRVQKGIIYQGATERLTALIAKIFWLLRGKKVNRLFAIDDLEEQKKFYKEEWDSPFVRKMFNLFLNTFLSKIMLEDPGLRNISSEVKPGDYIYNRIEASLKRELARKNPLLSLMLKGKVSQEAFAPCMTEEGTALIRSQLNKIEVQTANVLDYLESLEGPTFDAFSLSDVASYLSYPDFIRLLKGIIKTAKPGARFCLRQFLSSYTIPADLEPHFVRDKALEQKLEEKDNCFIYRFFTGTMVESASFAEV